MNTYEKIYGVPEMTLEAESQLSETERQTLRNKFEIVNLCGLMTKAVDQIWFRAKTAPITADPEHAQLVQQLADLVTKASDVLWEAAMYGIK